MTDFRHKILDSSTVSVIKEQVSSELMGEAVILNLNSGIYYGLNAVGAQIWNHLQQPLTVSEIQQALLTEYEVEAETCRRDVMTLLQELISVGLIEVTNAASTQVA